MNQALHALQDARVIRVEYGGVRVVDLEALRRYTPAPGVGARRGQRAAAGERAERHGLITPAATCPAGTWAEADST